MYGMLALLTFVHGRALINFDRSVNRTREQERGQEPDRTTDQTEANTNHTHVC